MDARLRQVVDTLYVLANRLEVTDPGVAGILFTLLAAMLSDDVDELFEHCCGWSAAQLPKRVERRAALQARIDAMEVSDG